MTDGFWFSLIIFLIVFLGNSRNPSLHSLMQQYLKARIAKLEREGRES